MNSWQPQVNEVIQGSLVQMKSDIGPNNSNVYVIQTEQGDVDIWGTTVLDQELPKIQIGTSIRIQYLGEKENPSTGRTYKSFKVWEGKTE